MPMDIAVLAIVVAVLILGVIDRGIWLDRCMGAILVLGGVYLFLAGCGALPRLWRKSSVIPYPVLGLFAIVQGICLGVFHVRF